MVEIGFDQAESAARFFSETGLKAELKHDLGGRPRALALTWE
jgi:hypothetical protein